MPWPEILHIGDRVTLADVGQVKVDRLDVCLRPSSDAAGEEYSASVDALELGEHGPTFVIGYGDKWAYGFKAIPGSIEGPYTVEKRCDRRRHPHLCEEEHENLTLEKAIMKVEDLGGPDDPDGIGELEPGESHTYTVDDDWNDEVEVRRAADDA